jgi:multicomponent Na+:H+ antiporter subunit E
MELSGNLSVKTQQQKAPPIQGRHSLLRLLQRTALFVLLWWLLAEGDPASWLLGLPIIVLAAGFSLVLSPPSPHSLAGLLHFVPFFTLYSLKGAFDVTWRALHPALPISPVLVDYRMRLSGDEARVFMANSISLLPGTLSAMIDGAQLQVHVLDGRRDFRSELEALEERVAVLFMDSLGAYSDDGH